MRSAKPQRRAEAGGGVRVGHHSQRGGQRRVLRREPARGGGQRGAARGRDRAAPELRGLLGLLDPAEEDEVHGRGRDGAE